MYTEKHEAIEDAIAALKTKRARMIDTGFPTRAIDDEISQLQNDLRR